MAESSPLQRSIVLFAVIIMAAALLQDACAGVKTAQALVLGSDAAKGSESKPIYRYGIPFLEGSLSIDPQAKVEIGSKVKRIFLLGMTNGRNPNAWAEARDYSKRYFVGDELGRILLHYADGTEQNFPLILGESIWWGQLFWDNQEPWSTDTRLQGALRNALRLYPQTPVKDGNYLAVITPKPALIRDITVEDSPTKLGAPVINGITVEAGENVAGSIAFPRNPSPPDFTRFVEEKALRPLGVAEARARLRLNDLRRALYSSSENYSGRVAVQTPRGYTGPLVSFRGNTYAEILGNVLHYNVQDIADKITDDGMYHTSTKGALTWGNYNGFGTYQTNRSRYYGDSFSRDMGRSLQELTEMGYIPQATRCADYCFEKARLWEEKAPAPKLNGHCVPRHWCQIINRPGSNTCLENDGHGLTTLFVYKLWQRLPDRDQWLRARWTDVKAAGDWILWQFDHPEISGATDLLHTTGECAGDRPRGQSSLYADYVCMDSLRALAEMADSIGEASSAAKWRERAALMQTAIGKHYIVTDPKYGRVWTLESAGWSNNSTPLGPLIFLADRQGFAPEDDNPEFRPVNQAAYRRMLDTYKPYGFFGTAMGYGQGFVTQAALLLDQMRDATQMLDWTAREVYDPRIGMFIVPESCQIDPTGQFWYRAGDLGNGVQEGEIVKAIRLVIGVDDTQPKRLRFFPRMPYGWTEIEVSKFPVLFDHGGSMATALLQYKLERKPDGIELAASANEDLGEVAVRLGPFEHLRGIPKVHVNGKSVSTVAEQSGDSKWVRLTAKVGTSPCEIDARCK